MRTMIKRFVTRFDAARESLLAGLMNKPPDHYSDLFHRLIVAISTGENDSPDPERITEIDHGDYQGTFLYVVGACGYQPRIYWATFVSYGSCSGCDTFQAIGDMGSFDSDEITEQQAKEYLTLMLHMLQGLKLIGDNDDDE